MEASGWHHLIDEVRRVDTNVVIVGAGPYGLSLASCLRANGVEHRIFGEPMKPWLTQMPEGMLLKSEDLHQIYMPLTAVTHWANIARKMDTPMSISGCPSSSTCSVATDRHFKGGMCRSWIAGP